MSENVYFIKESTITNIANSIREKTGETVNYSPSYFSNAINNIKSGGVDGLEEAFKWRYGLDLNGQEITDYIKGDYSFGYERGITQSPQDLPTYISNLYRTYDGCSYKLTGSPVCENNVIDMAYAYNYCTGLTGSPACGENVKNMVRAYYYCSSLTGSPACENNVTNMAYAYNYCTGLTGSPACGENVVNMYCAYCNCWNLTGVPVCGENVIDMHYAYDSSSKLTGSPVCGNNVTKLEGVYRNCSNLTGSPVCGNNVINMYYSYANCYKLTGSPVCGNNVTDMYGTYYFCLNLYGDMYIYYNQNSMSTNVDMSQCFYKRNNSNRLNIYVKADSAYNNWLYNIGTLNNTVKLTWTAMTNGYYNTGTNTYVYYNL